MLLAEEHPTFLVPTQRSFSYAKHRAWRGLTFLRKALMCPEISSGLRKKEASSSKIKTFGLTGDTEPEGGSGNIKEWGMMCKTHATNYSPWPFSKLPHDSEHRQPTSTEHRRLDAHMRTQKNPIRIQTYMHMHITERSK